MRIRTWEPVDRKPLPEPRLRIGDDVEAWSHRLDARDDTLSELRRSLGSAPNVDDYALWSVGGWEAHALEDMPELDDQLYAWCVAALDSRQAALRLKSYAAAARRVAWAYDERQALEDLGRWLDRVLAFHAGDAAKPELPDAATLTRSAAALARHAAHRRRRRSCGTQRVVHRRRLERSAVPPSPTRQPILRHGPPLLAGAAVTA